MNLVCAERKRRWVKPALGGVLLFVAGCAMAWPGRNAGSEGVFHLPYVVELFGAALIAASFGQRWRWCVGVVMILTFALGASGGRCARNPGLEAMSSEAKRLGTNRTQRAPRWTGVCSALRVEG